MLDVNKKFSKFAFCYKKFFKFNICIYICIERPREL